MQDLHIQIPVPENIVRYYLKAYSEQSITV